ncbi:MAG: 30S ribosomal protein S17 [Phycisphaerae bacterium]|jgi:small subunit ribosomal protein S17
MVDTVANTANAGQRRRRTNRYGTVVSTKGDKTVTVHHDYTVKHRKYGKYYRRTTSLHVHDEKNEAREGDYVEVAACRRLSKTKCWRLVRILRRLG